MILLTATTETLELLTGAALSTDWTVAYADHTTTTFTPGSGQGNVSTATTTTIVSAPASSTQRQVKLITVRNRDASGAQTVTLKKDISGTEYRLTPEVSLAAGETMLYVDGVGFQLLDSTGQPKNVTTAFSHAMTSSSHTAGNWKVFYSNGSGAVAELALGSSGQLLQANGASSAPTFAAQSVALIFVIDGGGSAITTGVKGYLEVPFGMTITGWTLVAKESGSIVIDVWKDTYANFPPTVADTIAGTEKPTLSSVQKNQDTSLSSWTTAITAGDVLGFNVDSITTCTQVTLTLRGTRP